MNKKIISLVMFALIFATSSASAVEPIFTDHRTFVGTIGDWTQTPANSWQVTVNDEARTIVNDTVTQTRLKFSNYIDISNLSLGENYEIDFSIGFRVESEQTITSITASTPIKFRIYENVGGKNITIEMLLLVTSDYYSPTDYYVWATDFILNLYVDGVKESSTGVTGSMALYQYLVSPPNYISIYQINYNGKTEIWFQDKKVETDFFIPDSYKGAVIIEYPTNIYNTSRNFTFYLQYFNTDIYAESIHREIIEEPTEETTFFDIIPVQNLIFILLLTATFILSVAKPEKIPKTVGLLALTFAISIVLYSLIKYYSESDLYAFIGGLLPIPVYMIRDRIPIRKDLFRR